MKIWWIVAAAAIAVLAVFVFIAWEESRDRPPFDFAAALTKSSAGGGSSTATGGGLVPATRTSGRTAPLAPSKGEFVVLVSLDRKPGTELKFSLSPARKVLSDSKVIQGIAKDLNQSLILPRNIPVYMRPCGEPNAFYDEGPQTITICDEWVTMLGNLYARSLPASEFNEVVVAATAFVFAHEVGHALIHQYDIDFTGQEEDVADQYAMYLLAGSETGAAQALAAADTFARLSGTRAPITWDNHALDEQRAYNILCWLYGSDPARYADLVREGILPQRRAMTCPDELNDLVRGLNTRLQPHLR